MFITAFTKENVVKAMDEHDAFTLTYRQMYKGEPVYVNLKAVRMAENSDFIIVGVNNVDAQMKQREALERIKQEHLTYTRITALSGDIICIYTVDPVTDHYSEYSATKDYEGLGLSKDGDNFFEESRNAAPDTVYEEDIDRFLSLFSKEKVMAVIQENKVYGIRYRLMINGEPKYVSLKAVLVDEPDGPKLIFGVQNIDSWLKRDHAFAQNIAIANAKINIDSLTGVKNKHAYNAVTEQIDERINDRHYVAFSVAVFGMKGLLNIKKNNSKAEEENWIKKAAEIIGGIFKRSPLFRLNNDEFVVISEGLDYEYIDDLINNLEVINDKNAISKDIVIPVGMAKYDRDLDVASVYARAVENMKEKYLVKD
jgi:GGDEF domain-containing protein